MLLSRLFNILNKTTTMLRKGDPVVQDKAGNIPVVRIFDMPHADEAPAELMKVDCHYVIVAVDKAALEAQREAFVSLMNDWPNPEELAAGPSYLAVGAALGDQGAAFRMFAAGEVLGLWKVITPAGLGATGDQAEVLAGMGYIMCSGYAPKPVAA